MREYGEGKGKEMKKGKESKSQGKRWRKRKRRRKGIDVGDKEWEDVLILSEWENKQNSQSDKAS